MEADSRIAAAERRTTDWPAAVVAGLAAGAVLMVLDILWSVVVERGGPWRTAHMIAPIFTGEDAAKISEFRFSWGVVAIALAVHYVVGILFGLVLGAIMTPLRFDDSPVKSVAIGAAFGLVLYLVNFYGVAAVFPWLAGMRGLATLAAHLVFGIVAALLYRRLERRPAPR
jgi:hypothetical protein